MIIKTLFFDTCAIVKFFINEPGHETIKWLCDSNTRMLLTLNISTSIQVHDEFIRVIERKFKEGNILLERKNKILELSKIYFKEVFHLRDIKQIPNFNFGNNTSELQIIKKYNLNPEKNSGDARIISCVINYLRFLDGASKLYIITSDKNFKKVITGEGYKLIDPEKSSINEIQNELLSVIN